MGHEREYKEEVDGSREQTWLYRAMVERAIP